MNIIFKGYFVQLEDKLEPYSIGSTIHDALMAVFAARRLVA